nr:MAG TPA: hypothetical protein [Caudoviricetes sp.]
MTARIHTPIIISEADIKLDSSILLRKVVT